MKLKQELITKKKKLPEGWRILPYEKCVAKLKLNKVKKYKVTEYLKEGKYPIIDQSKELINGYTNIENDVMYFETPVIIFGDHTLNVKYVDFPFARGADGTQIITPNINIVVPKYFYYHLLSLNIKVKLYERYFKYVKQSFFIIPPLPEQQKIVSKLDRQMTQIEMMKREAEKEKISSRNILYSELEEIFSNIKGKEILIENLIKDSVSGFACAINRLVKDGGYVHLRPFNIGGFGKLNLETQYQVPLEIVDREKYFLNKGNILFNNTNSTELVGKSVLIEEDYNYAFSNHINKIVVNKDLVIPQFFEYYLLYLWFIGHFARNCKKWIGQSGYTLNKLKEQHIIIPEMSKQEKIVEELNKIKDIQDSIKSNSESQMEALNQLLSSILNEVFGQYKIPEEA